MKIKIRIGKTRIAIICDDHVYKVVRFRLWDLTKKWLRLEIEKILYGDKIAYHNLKRDSRKQLIEDMLYACFRANYAEYVHWNKNPDKTRFVPTLFTFFYIINIQERVEVLQDYSNKFISAAHSRKCGMIDNDPHHDNYAKDGRILDYGSPHILNK